MSHQPPLRSNGVPELKPQALSCVLLRAGEPTAVDPQVMLCIPHRKNRLPVRLDSQARLLWHCADGQLEELAIANNHPDWGLVWKEIRGHGLLICEMPDGEVTGMPQLQPMGHWVLTPDGSQGAI